LRRIGTKGRPFYRVVVAKSTAGRNGNFVEVIGTYDPLTKPKTINIEEERALHWLRSGAQPSETTAYLLNKIGILEKYLQERPKARKQFSFLDKRTAATSVASVVDQPAAAAPAAPAPEPKAEAPAAPEAPASSPETPVEDHNPEAENAPEPTE
jgi:small subunit ribosomal protein S16